MGVIKCFECSSTVEVLCLQPCTRNVLVLVLYYTTTMCFLMLLMYLKLYLG